jgi:hypothetical protein
MNDSPIPDWIHPPIAVTPRTLWPLLHDATLEIARGDHGERAALLQFVGVNGSDEDSGRTSFHFESVASLRASVYKLPSQPFAERQGETREERNARVAHYQALGREESLSWDQLEKTINDNGLLIADADLLSQPSGVALRLQGHDQGAGLYFVVVIRSLALKVFDGSNRESSLEDLLLRAESHWR